MYLYSAAKLCGENIREMKGADNYTTCCCAEDRKDVREKGGADGNHLHLLSFIHGFVHSFIHDHLLTATYRLSSASFATHAAALGLPRSASVR